MKILIENDCLLKVLNNQKVDRTPIWLMRQAGRYLPEYRAVRKEAGNFLDLCKTPVLAAEVTLQPLARFKLDAAIIFSDILTIPDAYNLGLSFEEGEGPCFKHPIRTQNDVNSLPHIQVEEKLYYVMDAIRLSKKALNNKVPLIGFAGSPWTVATYMVEGKSSKNFSLIKGMLYKDPDLLKQLLQHLTTTTIDYLNAQVKAGADCLMIFDTWGGILDKENYLKFSLKYMQDIITGLKNQLKEKMVPITLFTKNGGRYLKEIAATDCNGIGLDWTAEINQARKEIDHRVALQGNIDPGFLYATPALIKNKVENLLSQFGKNPRHIFNLGHGIQPDTPIESVHALIEAVHSLSAHFYE
ncbi:MAG: hemE [Francisellaceae bacterium]|nr:hemE [Francisellaceae bacterium]